MASESKLYGVYANPHPGVWYRGNRLKTDAVNAGMAWWVNAESEEDAWETLLNALKSETDRQWLRERMDNGEVVVELEVKDERQEL